MLLPLLESEPELCVVKNQRQVNPQTRITNEKGQHIASYYSLNFIFNAYFLHKIIFLLVVYLYCLLKYSIEINNFLKSEKTKISSDIKVVYVDKKNRGKLDDDMFKYYAI